MRVGENACTRIPIGMVWARAVVAVGLKFGTLVYKITAKRFAIEILGVVFGGPNVACFCGTAIRFFGAGLQVTGRHFVMDEAFAGRIALLDVNGLELRHVMFISHPRRMAWRGFFRDGGFIGGAILCRVNASLTAFKGMNDSMY